MFAAYFSILFANHVHACVLWTFCVTSYVFVVNMHCVPQKHGSTFVIMTVDKLVKPCPPHLNNVLTLPREDKSHISYFYNALLEY